MASFYQKVIELLETISGGGGDTDNATETTLQTVNSKLPTLSGGKIPVEVGSLNVTVDNANLEISNDVGNPIPVSYPSTPTVNLGTIGNVATESTVSTINGKIPSNLTVSSTRLLVDSQSSTGNALVISGDTTITSTGTPTNGTITSGAYSVSIRMRYGTATVNGIVFNADEFNSAGLNTNGDPRGFTWGESQYGKYPAISYTVDANSSMSVMVRR